MAKRQSRVERMTSETGYEEEKDSETLHSQDKESPTVAKFSVDDFILGGVLGKGI